MLFNWVWTPKTYFVYLTAGAYRPLEGWPVMFASEDAKAFKDLKNTFVVNGYETPLTKSVLEHKLSGLTKLGRSKDTLILCLTAHGVIHDDGKPYLLCEPEGKADVADAKKNLLAISAVLDAVHRAPAGAKLLVLDAGRDNYTQQHATPFNTFPKLLEQAVQAAEHPDLWVISANAHMERSHVSWADHRSVMCYMLSTALAGRADDNDDRKITLKELYENLKTDVSAWVDHATSNNESQTPLLLYFESVSEAPELFLSSTTAPPDATELNEQRDVENAAAALDLSAGTDELASHVPAAARLTGQSGGGSDAREEAAPEDNSPATDAPAASNQAKTLPQQLDEAWKAVYEPTISENGPALWREVLERLLWCEQFSMAFRQPDKKQLQPVPAELQRIEESIKSLQSDGFRIPLESPPTKHISFALRELIAAEVQGKRLSNDEKELSDPWNEFVKKYDELLADKDSTRDQLNSLLEESKKKTPDALTDFYEFQLLDDLRSELEIPWELVQLALETRRLGEKAAANPLCGEGWARNTIEAADRRRWEGERLMLDRTDPVKTWTELSRSRLDEARRLYKQADDNELTPIRSAIQERNRILSLAPQYVRWAQLTRGQEEDASGIVRELFTLLKQLDQALSTPASKNINQLEPLFKELKTAHDALREQLAPADKPWRMANLLTTTLMPAGKSRSQLKKDLTASERQMFEQSRAEWAGLVTPARTEALWNEAREVIDLELEPARLAGLDESLFPQMGDYPGGSGDSEEEQCKKLNETVEKLRELYAELPELIESLAEPADFSSDEARRAWLTAVRTATRAWLLLGAQYQGKFDPKKPEHNPFSVLHQARWRELLHWHSKRFHSALDDAPEREVAYLRAAADEYRNLADEFPGPRFEEFRPPTLSIQQPTSSPLDLVSKGELQLPVTVKSLATKDSQLWIVAQYDSQLIEVTGRGVVSQDELRGRAIEAARGGADWKTTAYPYRPDRLRLQKPGIYEPSQLPAERTVDFSLTVKRRPDAAGTTKLILKAISADSFVRRELIVELPDDELPLLTVGAGREYLDATKNDAAVRLHPLPNREQSFAFHLVNRSQVEKTFIVSIWKARASTANGRPIIPPSRAQPPGAARKLLDSFQAERLTPDLPVTLPASNDPVPVPLIDPDQQLDLTATPPSPDPAAPNEAPEVQLGHTLLLVLKDGVKDESGKWTIRRIEILPQRPRNYLQAIAKYDPDSDRLDIFARAKKGKERLLPADGVKITLNVDDFWKQRSNELAAELRPPDYRANLHAYLLPSESQNITASVDVDGYPRAFIFQLQREQSSKPFEPASDFKAVRITSPTPKLPFQARPDKPTVIPVTLEVDAPYSAFDEDAADVEDASFVEIGIDHNQNGELLNEPHQRLDSDRQVTIIAKGFAADGTLTLEPRVEDLHVELATGHSGRAVDLLARLVTPGGDETSTVEILLDGAGPVVRPELGNINAEGEMEIGSELVVRVLAKPEEPDLTGIDKVEVTLDGADKWEPAKQVDGETWIAKLKTDKLGRHSVLVRATDKVGNMSEAEPLEFELVEKRPVKKLTPQEETERKTNSVTGRVTYGRDNIADATVTLEGPPPAIGPQTTDENGRFTFPKVPPGKYVLKAKGNAKGLQRNSEPIEIEVQPHPKKGTDVVVKLQRR